MEGDLKTGTATTLLDLTEDALTCVLSFLRPKDLSCCAQVCRRLRELCSEHGNVWLPMCHRRWGSFTNITLWGHGRVPHRVVYATLSTWENLIGFWRGVAHGGCGSLALFEWAPHRIVGYKVVPASPLHGYGVRKIPFLWMGISEDGHIVCFVDPAFKLFGRHDSQSPDLPSHSAKDIMNMDAKTSIDMGMLLVDVHFVGKHHLVIEEIIQSQAISVNLLAEAVTIAAFGNSHSLDDVTAKSPYKNIPINSSSANGNGPYGCGKSPHSSSSECDSYIGSPPSSFQYEMYQFLVNKVSSSGSDRAGRKQKKKDKVRGFSQGKCILEPEHFVKVLHASPTMKRPLQGLWKGFFDTIGLDFVLITYDDKDGIICRKVQDRSGTSKCGSVLWTSESSMRFAMPLSLDEEAFYNSCTHIQPSVMQDRVRTPISDEIVGALKTSSCDFQSILTSNSKEGRIFQYCNGNFGFSYIQSNQIVDFKSLCSEGSL